MPAKTAIIAAGSPPLPVVRDGDRMIVLADARGRLDEVIPALRQNWTYTPPPDAAEVWLALGGTPVPAPTTIKLGVRAVSPHDAIAATAGLPSGWRKAQADATDQVLRPLRIGNTVTVADLYVNSNGERINAARFIEDRGLTWTEPDGRLVYFLAEAGKGKSTLFGHAAHCGIANGTGPLPVYASLRALPRGAGVSWDQVAREFGAVGPAASRLATAIKAGLITPFLDGLDEVSGRYDPQIVRDVATAVRTSLIGPRARVFLSGRTTEASEFEGTGTTRLGVELPLSTESAFQDYAERVTEGVVNEWGTLAARIPEPTSLGLDVAIQRNTGEPPTPQQRAAILRWVEASFDELGKDRSLFFVQSLAFIARSYQLNGNRALVIEQPGAEPEDAKVAKASVTDACFLAASLACAREEDKVDPIARSLFSTGAQLDILTAFALLASAPSDLRSEFPPPREIVRRCTRVDHIGQLEEFVAMDRQMQKHALLIAQEGSVGDWTPTFLSDWIRSALLVRAWSRLQDGIPVAGLPPDLVRSAIPQAQRAHFAFGVLFPEKGEGSSELTTLSDALSEHAQAIPEAAANQIRLQAALHGAIRPGAPVPAFTDITALDADDVSFDDVEASYILAGGSIFDGCAFTRCTFDVCDFPGVTFSNCTFDRVAFRGCTGPATYIGCTFASCEWTDASSATRPAWAFVESTFDALCQVVQASPLGPHDALSRDAVSFVDCVVASEPSELVVGEWSRSTVGALSGLELESVAAARPPGELALRSVMRTFFPDWIGSGPVPQPRAYIRSSALGRGAVPAGMPSNSTLMDILWKESFSKGGRANHVYGPWSDVGGRTSLGLEMKSAYTDYLVNGRRNEFVDSLQTRLERAAGWEPRVKK